MTYDFVDASDGTGGRRTGPCKYDTAERNDWREFRALFRLVKTGPGGQQQFYATSHCLWAVLTPATGYFNRRPAHQHRAIHYQFIDWPLLARTYDGLFQLVRPSIGLISRRPPDSTVVAGGRYRKAIRARVFARRK